MIITDELIILGKQIRKLRNSKGYTIRTLSEMTHIDKMQIVKIEAGRADAKFSTLCRIATALNVTMHELIPIAANMSPAIDNIQKG
ncbi:MAG: helix-turn-helix domain-containing protein [Acutalibacteraceae bacterium]